MNAADREHAAARQGARQGEPGGSADAQDPSVLLAGAALLAALGHLLGGLRKLAAAEGRVLRAGIPLFFMAAVALVAFAVSLWVCLVALMGWALMVATQSLGLALGLLVVIHAVLVIGVWSLIKYSLRQATFPRARAELRLIGLSLLYDLHRVAGAGQAGSAPAANAEEEDNP